MRIYFNNFEMSRIDVWRDSGIYRKLYAEIDADNGIYRQRWGDAPIRTMAAQLLKPVYGAEGVRMVQTFDYHHDELYPARSPPPPMPLRELEHVPKPERVSEHLLKPLRVSVAPVQRASPLERALVDCALVSFTLCALAAIYFRSARIRSVCVLIMLLSLFVSTYYHR